MKYKILNMKTKYKVLTVLGGLILIVFGFGITYSVFNSSSTLSSNNQGIAKFIFNAESLDEIQLPLVDINPGDNQEYSFSVSNNYSGKVSDVLVEYKMTIKTYHLTPLTIQLYKLNGETEVLILNCDETTTRDSQNEIACDSPTQEMGHSLEKFDNYKLKVGFPSEYSDETYSDLVDYINLEIKSWQKTGSEIVDNDAPVITLLNDNPLDIERGTSYVESGATAVDTVDGDLTDNIIITGTVDTNTVGTYTVTYTVSDQAGNQTVVTRTVNVIGPTYAGPGYITSKGVNGPVLATGMTPIKWDGSTWVDTATNDPEWYDYATKKWANAKTTDGSMWVWIPRYAYKITSGYHSVTTGAISVKFLTNNTNNTLDGTNVVVSNQSNVDYVQHPVFKFGTTEVTGIWVSKFEASVSNKSDACYTSESAGNCDKSTLSVKISPNVYSWRYINIGNAFTASRNMETNSSYGWGTSGNGIDTHLMKNTEWGAVAYLTQSQYGKNSEIFINNSSVYYTGCSGGSVSASAYSGCQYSYETPEGQGASTTGNIYGIYDMSGGAEEHTSANYNNLKSSSTIAPTSILDKYIDRYSGSNYGYNNINYGDAVFETSNGYVWNGTTWIGTSNGAWYGDRSSMPNPSAWFARGGRNSVTNLAGIYNFLNQTGGQYSYTGFRVALIVGEGL